MHAADQKHICVTKIREGNIKRKGIGFLSCSSSCFLYTDVLYSLVRKVFYILKCAHNRTNIPLYNTDW